MPFLLDFLYFSAILGLVTFKKGEPAVGCLCPQIGKRKSLAFYMDICYDVLRLPKKQTIVFCQQKQIRFRHKD